MKLLELLKLPCSPLVTTTNQSSTNTNTSDPVGVSQQSSLQESSDTMNTSEQLIKLDSETIQNESSMNTSQYSIASDTGEYSNKWKRPYNNNEKMNKSTPNLGDEEVVLLCNEK
ncbi:unnamed protein product, partial [Schistosoma turkestanicum]